MRHYLYCCFLLFLVINSSAQPISEQRSLDKENPILFNGDCIIYQHKIIKLGQKAYFIDGQLSDDEAARYPYVFNSVNSVAKSLSNGSEKEPMVLYIAPYVYWIDNPDDELIRKERDGSTPYGLKISCDWLQFYGLTDDPQNVVLACNRGQTIGAIGNFTMLKLLGDGISTENITFGNYCNVDLNYQLKPELNREKRAEAIVQAQLIHCNGDKIVARNTNFISRLNLCNFVGAKRILFDRCHMESTDDALCGTGVYLNCTFDFYSPKPFYNTTGTGAVFLNCNINSHTSGSQHFTKANGQLAIIDTRITSKSEKYISWNNVTPIETRNYQYNVTLNGDLYRIGNNDSVSTLEMNNKEVLNGYRILLNDTVYYNTYNLLKGDDNWDPMGCKLTILRAEKRDNKPYSNIPTKLQLNATRVNIETGKDTVEINTTLFRFGNYKATDSTIVWKISETDQKYAKLQPSVDGSKCMVIPTNQSDITHKIVVSATTKSGLEAATVINISPKILPAPNFSKQPQITTDKKGNLTVNYKLDGNYADQSRICWFREKDSVRLKVGVSRQQVPLKRYKLTTGDIGAKMWITIEPKNSRSIYGISTTYNYKKSISTKDVIVTDKQLMTDFKEIPVENQLKIVPGFWTFRPLETERNGTIIKADDNLDAWYFGMGYDGNANMLGLLQTGRSATMLYTPVAASCNDMSAEVTVSPSKTAGQGFSVAHLYMDVLIKLDTKTMTGYGLRFIRTTKYGNAVDCYFVKYKNGDIEKIGQTVTTSCFRSPCKIQISTKENTISAHISTTDTYVSPDNSEVLPEVSISTVIETNTFGGFGVQYNGGAKTMINSVNISWK